MDNIAGSKSGLSWAVQISTLLIVLLWLFPTVGLLVSSFRTADQISASGWWAALFPQEQNEVIRLADPDEARVPDGAMFVVEGNLFEGAERHGRFRPDDERDALHAVEFAGGIARGEIEMQTKDLALLVGKPFFPLRHAWLHDADTWRVGIG